MCPASTSTTMPSGRWQSVTMTFFSEPSGFTVKMRPPLRSRTNKRPAVLLATDLIFGFETCLLMFFSFKYQFVINRLLDHRLATESCLCSREVRRALLNECREGFPGVR